MKIGARVVKTGLAITLSVYLSLILIPDNSASLAAIAAITTTMPSVRQSFDVFTKRVIANVIGGLVAVLMMFTIGNNPVSIGLAAILTIAILNGLKLSAVLNLSVITVVAVMLSSNDNFVLTALYRVLETIIGVTVSFMVNWLVYPPRYDKRFYDKLTDATSEVLVLIRAALRKNITFSILHRDINEAKSQLAEIKIIFNLMREEVIFSKKQRQWTARRLVIYKHMVKTFEQTVNLLEVLHNNDHVFSRFDSKLQLMVRERIETLMTGHEQILLKFSGRVSADEVNFLGVKTAYRENYLQSFFNQTWSELEQEGPYDSEVNGVIHIMSAIYSYEEELMKLNDLIRIYRQRYNIEDGVEEMPEEMN